MQRLLRAASVPLAVLLLLPPVLVTDSDKTVWHIQNPDALKWRADTLHAIEAGEGVLAELAHLVADAIVGAHLATMLRLDIEYDLLPRESEILHLQFWATAFELLKQRYRAGIPRTTAPEEQRTAERVLALLLRTGGTRATGGLTQLPDGIFWPVPDAAT